MAFFNQAKLLDADLSGSFIKKRLKVLKAYVFHSEIIIKMMYFWCTFLQPELWLLLSFACHQLPLHIVCIFLFVHYCVLCSAWFLSSSFCNVLIFLWRSQSKEITAFLKTKLRNYTISRGNSIFFPSLLSSYQGAVIAEFLHGGTWNVKKMNELTK